jgi:glucokinase
VFRVSTDRIQRVPSFAVSEPIVQYFLRDATVGAPVTRIGVDVGGTHLRAALVRFVDGRADVLAEERLPTGSGAHGSQERILELVDRMIAVGGSGVAPGIEGVGIGLAGHLGLDGVLRQSAHTSGLVGVDLAAEIGSRVERVIVENDANCTGLAAFYTSDRPFEPGLPPEMMLLATMGTGIGGAILVGGKLIRGAAGMAGEFGHMVVDPDGLDCPCGQTGCWETVAAGSSLARMARAAMPSQESPVAAHEVENWLTDGLAAEDADAVAVFEAYADAVALGLGSLVQIFDPDQVVIGGGVTAHGDRLLRAIDAAVAVRCSGYSHRNVRLRLAPGGPRAGVVGAALASLL